MAVNVRMPEVHPRGLQFGILTFLLTAALLGGPRPAIAERGYLDRIRGVVEVPNPDQVRGLQPRIEVLSVDPQTARPDATIRVRLTAGVHMKEDRWKTQFRVTSEPGHAFFEGCPEYKSVPITPVLMGLRVGITPFPKGAALSSFLSGRWSWILGNRPKSSSTWGLRT